MPDPDITIPEFLVVKDTPGRRMLRDLVIRSQDRRQVGKELTMPRKAKAAEAETDTKVKVAKGKAKKGATKAPSKADKAGNKAAKGKVAKTKKAPSKADNGSKAEKDTYGFRVGSKKSQAAAIYASKAGATLAEVKEQTGSAQLNLLKELADEGYPVRSVKEQGDGARKVTRYFLGKKSK